MESYTPYTLIYKMLRIKNLRTFRVLKMGLKLDIENLYQIFNFLGNTPLSVKDKNGVYLYVNDSFCKKFIHQDPHKVIGCHPKDLYPSEQAKAYIEQDRIVVETRQPLQNMLELFPQKK
jgi:hypothetical protein